MCDLMTSHLYHITKGIVVHTLYGHSDTRHALNIDHKDESYVEVEWHRNNPNPEIRFPASWRQEDRDVCNTFYSKFDHQDELIKFLLPLATTIKIAIEKENLIPDKLPKCKFFSCSYTGITKLPELPNCEYLHCSFTEITELPELPKCEYLYCSNTKITALPDLPECKELHCDITKIKDKVLKPV